MINNSEDSNVQEETWGWGPYGSEEDVVESTAALSIEGTPSRETPIRRNTSAELKKSSSERSFNSRRQHSSQALKGIASSPSFQELEKAIGVALSQSTEDNGSEPKTLSPSTSFSSSKLSSTNLMQQKVMQHRVRQHQQLMNSYPNQGQRINNSAPGLKISTSSGNLSAKSELAPFINESESRALILFHSPTVPQNIIKDVCSKFGVLYYIRPEFHARGLTLLSYFDLQAALAAKDAIPTSLGPGADASVFYSIMLHATTSNTEEFRLIVKNLPDSASEMDIQTVFSRYGPLRSIQKTFGSSTDLAYGDARSVAVSYSVEFFNIQDARLAASELSATSTSIWGTDAAVRFAPLDERKKQLCKQLLGFLSRWRSEISSPMSSHPQFTSHQPGGQLAVPVASGTLPMSLPPQVHYPMIGTGSYQSMSSFQFGAPMEYGLIPQMTFQAPMLGTQLNPPMFPAMYGAPFSSPYGPPTFVTEHGNHGNHGNMQLSVHPVVTDSSGLMVNGRDSFVSKPKDLQDKSGVYRDGSTDNTREESAHSNTRASLSSFQQGRPARNNSQRDGHENDFSLDINRILAGAEKRTTIMVRNIPNKYTQQMLLEEVNQKHAGTYDFFYLPIDFKNRCNVGYCFINFLSTSSIPAFVETFHGQRWKSFNSEKVCAVSFARIQGKQAMIARFQNSSLMDKVDEYKPLLFYSSGPNIGKPEPFPTVASKTAPTVPSSESEAKDGEGGKASSGEA